MYLLMDTFGISCLPLRKYRSLPWSVQSVLVAGFAEESISDLHCTSGNLTNMGKVFSFSLRLDPANGPGRGEYP